MVTETEKQLRKLKLDQNQEIVKVFSYLGRRHTDGDVKGDHLRRILQYLIQQKTEDYDVTLAKLALLCGMMKRYVKENYLEGLEHFGVIDVSSNSRNRVWVYRGVPDDKELDL